MKEIFDKAVDYISSSTFWIHGTIILIVSMILMLDQQDINRSTWLNYIHFILLIGLLFLPILLFNIFKAAIKKRFPKYISFIWMLVYLVFPLVIWFLKLDDDFLNTGWDRAFLPVVVSLFLLAELGIYIKDKNILDWNLFNRLKQLNIEKSILLGLIPLALIAVDIANGTRADIEQYGGAKVIAKYIWYGFQFYIIFFIYYLFYALNHYVLINKVFKSKGFIYYVFSFLASIIIFYPISSQLISFLPIVQKYHVHPSSILGVFDPMNANIPIFIMLLSIPFILSYQWLVQNNAIVSLEKEKSETELSLLKQQINPHFFFNTLNNLYAMSLTKDPQTPETILQLSELMRYVIYKGRQSKVALNEEIKYIEDYINLQQIRLASTIDLTFEKDIDDEQIQIPPLLFIIFVENGFKHGIEDLDGKCSLNIKLTCKNDDLKFYCKNSIDKKSTNSSGIGLENLQKRLDFHYPNRNKLEFSKNENHYIAIMTLKLKV